MKYGKIVLMKTLIVKNYGKLILVMKNLSRSKMGIKMKNLNFNYCFRNFKTFTKVTRGVYCTLNVTRSVYFKRNAERLL